MWIIFIFVYTLSLSLSLCHCVSVSLGPFRCSRCVCETCGTGQRRRSEWKHPDPRPTDRCENLLPDPGRSLQVSCFFPSPPDISACLSLQLDGVSLHGLTNQEVLEVMKRTGQTVVLSVVRKKPRGLERSLDKGIYLFFLQEPRQRHIRGSFLCHVETILDLEALGP